MKLNSLQACLVCLGWNLCGLTSPLRGGGLVETKQSRWRNSTQQPRRRSRLGLPQKAAQGCLARSASSCAKNSYLPGSPGCLGAALWRHCPSHKRSKVDGAIPRSSPGVDLGLDFLKRLRKAVLPNQPSACPVGLPGPAAWGRPCALPLQFHAWACEAAQA